MIVFGSSGGAPLLYACAVELWRDLRYTGCIYKCEGAAQYGTGS